MDCDFCLEFARGYFELGTFHMQSRIVLETDHFFVFPSVGSFVSGYLLIAPKRHVLSMADTPAEQLEELEQLLRQVRALLTDRYEQTVFFEHGPCANQPRGISCVEHAHIHALPTSVNVWNELAKDFPVESVSYLSELVTRIGSNRPYLFYEDQQGTRSVFVIPEMIPSQHIRKLIAGKLGKSEWNWRQYPFFEEMIKTMHHIKD